MTLFSIYHKVSFVFKSQMPLVDKIKLLLWTTRLYLLSGYKNGNRIIYNDTHLLVIRYHGHTLRLRLMDLGIFYNIFQDKIYTIPDEWTLDENLVLVDVGAHIGLASLFFYIHYPSAFKQYHCIEPTNNNFDLLQSNTACIPNVHCHKIALSDYDGAAHIDHSGYGHNAHLAATGQEVSTWTWATLLHKQNISERVFLKIDVEGQEKQILHSLTKHLPSFILMEYHYDDSAEVLDMLIKGGTKIKTV